MKDFLGACLLGAVLGAMMAYGVPAKAQTYVVQDTLGYTQAYVQQNGQTLTVTTQQGNLPLTVYPTQITNSYGGAIGTPSYTVPMTPPSPPAPRVLQ